MSVELRIIAALWFILPAYFANSMPVVFSKVKELDAYGKPVDGGRSWMGARILGDGKTWRGLLVGVVSGTFIGWLQILYHGAAIDLIAGVFPAETIVLPQMTVPLAFMLSFGALIGDMVASFFKRRANLSPGEPAPLLDQLDFIFGGFLFSWFVLGSIDREIFFWAVVITPVIHLIGNIFAWIWKLKKNPW